jgi:hypothetical protein
VAAGAPQTMEFTTLPPIPDVRPLGTRVRRAVIAVFLAFALFLVGGNLTIAAAWKWQSLSAAESSVNVDVSNFTVVDGKLWRGAAPGNAAYREMAKKGVRTVVDLRAEDGIFVDEALLTSLGVRRIQIPMRDGQAPTPGQVQHFLDVVERSPGKVYVHCGAGVGRTGAMVASYLVATGQANGRGAMRRNLAVGPPSLEQLAFASGLRSGKVSRVNPAVVAVSRVLDAPRRLWITLK